MQAATIVRRLVSTLGAAALLAGGLVALPAQADTAPADPSLPTTVSADGLPTVQINGVVWNQQIVGNTVYVGGSFSSARPAGSPAGSNETPRANFLAYNLTTGALITTFAPTFNAQVNDITVSPDQKTLYVAGNFTTVNGQNRYRIAAFDVATGALSTAFRPTVNSVVNAVQATNSAVFIAGSLTSVNGSARTKVAALAASNGATLPMTTSITDGTVQGLAVSPDGGSLVISGSFTSVNGSSNPGYGLARVDTSTGANQPLPVNEQVRNGGPQASMLQLESDSTQFYGTGFHFGSGGNVEGAFAADWATGTLQWIEDCHGDTYSAYPAGGAVYEASHKHYCGNSGGFPQTDPWTYHRATAVGNAATRINTPDIYGYPDHAGQPSPTFLGWYPDLNYGTYTGKSQGPWTVNGNADYVLMGGEFTTVNGVGQQGLVRFARSALAPNLQGPRTSGANYVVSAASFATGTVRVAWKANWDRDNETLTYRLYRASTANPPIYTETMTTPFWDLKPMGFMDTGLTPGSSQRYRVIVSDPFGNTAMSDWVTVTVSASGTMSDYANAVLADDPASFWRLGEPSGTTVYDWAGFNDATAGTGVTRGVTGAIGSDTNTASGFDGTGNGLVSTRSLQQGPQLFTIETWFRTTTTTGGKIVGFGNAATGNSSNYDRHIYMEPSGQVTFGVYPGGVRTVTSGAAYNDGQWHQAVASLSGDGMKLYVDGKRVAQRSDTTSAQPYSGYWRIGGDSPWSGDAYFHGDIDDVAIYDTALSGTAVNNHWVASGRTTTIQPAPADAYGKAVYDLGPDLFWRLGESSGSVAADASTSETPGGYSGGVTKGAAGAIQGLSNTAATFDGVDGLVVSSKQFTNPTTYSQELWFKTTTTNGGKLIGFGNHNTGTSDNYDRHVYMENSGQLTFGVWTGFTNTITSPLAYNDGAWHQMVATQSSTDGMKLFVDGALVGTNGQTSAQDYTGYWRVGGDTTWGPQPWFAGTIDEVAVYSTALTAQQIAQHYALGTNAPPVNQAPVAAFTSSVSNLTASVDGSTSADPDGTIASYAWDFGDSQTGTGATTSHLYAAGGTYTVTLTVTDNQGATNAVSHPVTVTAPTGTELVKDLFTRAVAGGWGSAEVGGPWTSTGTASKFSVDGTAGVHTASAGNTLTSSLGTLASTATDTTATVSVNKVPNGGGAFAVVQGRQITATNAYAVRLRLQADGSVLMHITRGNGTPIVGGTVAGLTYAAGDKLQVRLQVQGASPTTLRARVWKVGTTEPTTWSTITDSTAGLQVAGGVGIQTYLFGTVTNGPVAFRYDDLVVNPIP
ncbi:MAG TPA: LamG-like jellyroll fold domain-containing protein [Actinotalea sp.]